MRGICKGMGAKVDFWKGHVAEWRCSGLTQAAYCRQHELSLARF
ncbi:MAG: IS66 family insertion sequence element accessory protein TnpA, partial [Steroidobacteraceae bacterium]